MMYLPKCRRNYIFDQDCFALRSDGKCGILKQGYKDKECPFYRPASEVNRIQIEEDCKAYAETKGEIYVG